MPVHTFLVQPFHIGVAGAVQVMPGREIVTEIRIAVIHAWLVIVPGRGDMQFPDEPAIISGVGKAFCDQRAVLRQVARPIDIGVDRRRITPCQETGSAGCADGVLAVCVGESDTLAAQAVQVGRINE